MLNALAGLGLAGGAGVPGMVLPGGLRRLAVLGVVAGGKVDYSAPEAPFFENERLRRPFQRAVGQDLCLGLLPGINGGGLGLGSAGLVAQAASAASNRVMRFSLAMSCIFTTYFECIAFQRTAGQRLPPVPFRQYILNVRHRLAEVLGMILYMPVMCNLHEIQ